MSSTRADRGDGVMVVLRIEAPRAALGRSARVARRSSRRRVKKEEKKDDLVRIVPRRATTRTRKKDSSKDAKKDDKKVLAGNSEKDAKAKVLTGAVGPDRTGEPPGPYAYRGSLLLGGVGFTRRRPRRRGFRSARDGRRVPAPANRPLLEFAARAAGRSDASSGLARGGRRYSRDPI